MHRLIAFSLRPLGTTLVGFLLQYAGSTLTILAFTSLLVVPGSATLLNVHIHHAPAL
jgi:hypothetical protein